jgi:parallel beta-helix repeat protein
VVGSSSAAQTFTVSNTGTADLVIGTISITGTNPGEFGKQNDNCSGQTIAPSGNCTVQAVFSPTSAGGMSANLNIPSNVLTVDVPLSGTGIKAVASVSPTSHNFGNIVVGSSSAAQTFTVSNTGTADLVIGTISITGTNPGEFGKQNDNCSGQTIAPSGNCTVQAVFSPTSAGEKSANLSIPSNASGSPTLVPLSGTGATEDKPHIRIPIEDIDFGIVNVETCIDRTTTIYNDGTATLTVNNITRLSGSTEFTYIGPGVPFTIPASGSKTVTLRYCPTSGSSAVFNVNSNDPVNTDVTFNVTGTEAVSCTIYVPLDYPTIQQAINAASDGCTIFVSSGTYTENINFYGKAIRVKGAGSSGVCGCPEEGSNKVTINGMYHGSVVTFNSGETRNSILEGFTIINGFAPEGGGIFIENASPTIKDCIIHENVAYETGGISYGGGIYISGSSASPLIFNNIIIKNSATSQWALSQGGGIYITNSASPTIQNCTIADNTSNYVGGGGIHVSLDSSPHIIDSIIWNNDSVDLICEPGCGMNVTYSDVGEAIAGIGNISSDPLFTGGAAGIYYLSHIRAGQDSDSPCIDSGSTTALNSGLDTSNTASDGIPDRGQVDMGYHYVPTPIYIQKAWTDPGDIFHPGETIIFNITYRVEGDPSNIYEVTLKLFYQRGNDPSTRRSLTGMQTRYPGLYTVQFKRTVPSGVAPGLFRIGYVAEVKQVGGAVILGRDVWISAITIE